jgi:trk system potassium uptake protein TrkH
VTLLLVAILLLGGATLFWVVEGSSGILKAEPWWRQALLSFYQSTSARTAGFMAVSTFADLRPASQILMIALMFVGSAPASMGGGITTGTLAVLALSVLGYARGQVTPTVFGRRLAARSVPRAAAVVSISLAVVATATWLLLVVSPAAVLEEALFEVVSAFATTGLSLNYTSRMNWAGQLVIMFVMFWGRLGALTIIVALTRQRPTPAVTYPEEPMLIG